MFKVLHLRHHSEPVASPNLDNILLAIFAAQQLEGEIDEFRRVGETSDAAVSIKVYPDLRGRYPSHRWHAQDGQWHP